MEPKVIALDIGQVCVQVRQDRCFMKLGFSPEPEVLKKVLYFSDELEKGHITLDEFFEKFQKLTGLKHSQSTMLDAFNSIIAGPMPGMAELLAAMPQWGIRPVFFSNTSSAHLKEVRRVFPAAAAIPDGIYSFEVGAMKPEEAIFEAFEQRFGRPALYIDDRPDLIAVGAKRGWEGYCFKDAADLEKNLRIRHLISCK